MELFALTQLQFWKKFAQADRAVLALDYDGTLAPFVADRNQAFPYPEIIPPLNDILAQGKTRVIIISGREIASLRPLLPFTPLPELWGNHGHERCLPDGTYSTVPLSQEIQKAFLQAEEELRNQGVGSFVERKPASLALHWRGVTQEERQRINQAYENILYPLAGRDELEIHPFDGGWELKHISCNKGEALQTILSEEKGDIPIAYLGDDLTDEDAFAKLQGKGLSVLVRTQHRNTIADLWIQPPQEVVAFLTQWKHAENLEA